MLKASRQEEQNTNKGQQGHNWLQAENDRKQQNNTFKIQRDSKCQIRTPYLVKLSFKNGVKENLEK